MGPPESKGKGWFGKIYNKLETLLVEVDSFASQSTLCLKPTDDLPGFESVRGEPKEITEVHPSNLLSHQNFDVPGHVMVEKRVQGDMRSDTIVRDAESLITNTLTTQKFSAGSSSVFTGWESVIEFRVESFLPDGVPIIIDDKSWINNTLTPHKVFVGNPLVSPGEESVEEDIDESFRDVVASVLAALGIFADNISNLNDLLAAKIPDELVQDNEANMRSSHADDVINGIFDVAPLDINVLYHIECREDLSYVDDNAMCVRAIATEDTNTLYGTESREDLSYVEESVVRLGTKKLGSFKKKILDALTSKRRRKKEYEQLAIQFGDADMSFDLATAEDSKQVEAMDSKSSQLIESEDSQWELV